MSGVKGQSGRRAKPRAIKELAGTFRADQHNPNEPTLPVFDKVPACPKHLQGEARKAWRRTARVVVQMGILTEADLPAMEAYCVTYAIWKEAHEKLVEFGIMHRNASGRGFAPSPYLRVLEDTSKQMRGWMLEFGITPSSRSRVSKAKAEEEDESFDDYFFNRRN